jgi:hypothetical protein
MRCDRCNLELERYGDRDKWRCKSCLAVIVGAADLGAELGALGEGLAEPIDTSRLADAARNCPTCAGPMNQLKIDGIVIERCPKDFTLWFDAGELGKIRAMVDASEASPVLVRVWTNYFNNLD